MPAKRSEVTVTLEEEVPARGEAPVRRVQVSTTLRPADSDEVSPEDVAGAVRALSGHIKSAVGTLEEASGAPSGPRPDRPLADLVQTYRAKSPELVDALLWEGELTPTEHQALQAAVRQHRVAPTPSATAPSPSPPSPPSPPSGPASAPPARSPASSPPSSPSPAPSQSPSPPSSPDHAAAPGPAPAPTSAPAPAGGSSQGGARSSARSVETLIHDLDLKDMRDVNRARGREAISYEEWASLKARFERRA